MKTSDSLRHILRQLEALEREQRRAADRLSKTIDFVKQFVSEPASETPASPLSLGEFAKEMGLPTEHGDDFAGEFGR